MTTGGLTIFLIFLRIAFMKEKLLHKIEENHISCMQEIKKYLSSNKKDLVSITTYLLNTDANPYHFLEKKWAEAIHSSSGFLNFLQTLEKAIYYSKEICFPVIDGVPKIVFQDKGKFNITEYLDTTSDTDNDKQVYFLSNIQEFIYEHSCHQFQITKEHFFHHAHMYGLDKAIEEFKEKDCFDNCWIQEYNQEN